MSDLSRSKISLAEKREVFHKELDILREKRLIPKTDYIRIGSAYERHYNQVLHQSMQEVSEKPENFSEDVPASSIETNRSAGEQPVSLSAKTPAEQPQVNVAAETRKYPEISEKEKNQTAVPDSNTLSKQTTAKPAKTAEQIRERNIAAVLIAGVVFLLFGGLILATSTWGALNSVLKVSLISLVSVFFAVMAFISAKLKIRQTAFAFLTLAGMFIPISILSASYYKIFGEYLSLQGEGRGLLGFMGGLVCLFIYYKIAAFFKSRVFIFISLATFAATSYFGLSFITPSKEMLFLLLAVFNLLLVWNVSSLKTRKVLQIYRSYIFQFIQFKIIAETFVILTLFEGNWLYSLAVLLSSLVFLILSLKHKGKYYGYVFSALFSYGYFHLVYTSFLEQADIVAIGLLPVIFSVIWLLLSRIKHPLSTDFLYTSMIASALVFIYMNGLFYQENYAQMAIALFIMMAQFVSIALLTANKVFTYPVAVLINLALYDLAMANHFTISETLTMMFAFSAVLFAGGYLFNTSNRWRLFRESTLYIEGSLIFLLTLAKVAGEEWLTACLFLLVISALFFIAYGKEETKSAREVCRYGFPISACLSLLLSFLFLTERIGWYDVHISPSIHLMMSALIAISAGFLLRKSYSGYFSVFFISGQVLSFISHLLIYADGLNPYGSAGLMLAATMINILSVHQYQKHYLWLAVLFTGSGAYGYILDALDFKNQNYIIACCLAAPLVFYLISEFAGRYSRSGKLYFFWYSHLLNLAAIPAGCLMIIMTDASPFLYLFVLVLYPLCAARTVIIRERYIFAYVGFAALYLQVCLFFRDLQNMDYFTSVTMSVTAAIIIVLWFMFKTWKYIIEWYLIPFLLLTNAAYIMESYTAGFPQKMKVLWTGGAAVFLAFTLYLLMKRKWENLASLPLLLAFIFFSNYASSLPVSGAIGLTLSLTAIMLLLSRSRFKGVIKREASKTFVDAYRIFGWLFLLSLQVRLVSSVFRHTTLEILVACLIAAYFGIIRMWTEGQMERKIYMAALFIASLYPYYLVMKQIPVPEILSMEVLLIPVMVISSILLRKIFNYGKTSQLIELLIVAFVFLILVSDSIAGNTVNDAIVIGVISLASILTGFFMKYKSYFLSGGAVLLFNVYMNTKSMWGNLPWWLYLIIGGILMIAAASFLEWKKQREHTTSKELLDKNKMKIKNWFSKWK
ncbi:hypothetical protein SAMN05443252_10754 [Bacillus sp. OV322]|uniref:hypothetical protein n=1 Tax=Bacillus sp. OV322 TaxID=1882764 RepID=UPI0008ED5BFA|nr:hypothetical protein [Bacillus sp. OV322]SFC85558.1 hypothetical protein SAMN05443252_10754 [Bacillus sp. OV322]